MHNFQIHPPILPANPSDQDLRGLPPGGHLESLKVTGCELAGIIAKALSIDGVVFENCEISSSKLHKSTLGDVELINCLLFGTDFDGSGWLRIALTGGMSSGLVVTDSTLQDVSFRSAKLNLANFRMSRLRRVEFRNCDLSDADFQGSDLKNVVFKNCNLAGVEFSGCKAERVDLRNSNISTIRGVNSLKGATISTEQMMSIAPVMAAELGLDVQN
jgi:uncharacterized protein YjbI with pentapeptide repeats